MDRKKQILLVIAVIVLLILALAATWLIFKILDHDSGRSVSQPRVMIHKVPPVPKPVPPPAPVPTTEKIDAPTLTAPDLGDMPTEKSPVEKPPAQGPATVPEDREVQELPAVYTVQVGAFIRPRNALYLLAYLQKEGYPEAYIKPLKSKDGRQWHLVRIGDFTEFNKAKSAARAYMAAEKAEAVVTPMNASRPARPPRETD